MAIVVTNTLTRRKEPFVPRDEGKVGMYVCGPTVYDHIHIGNARSAIVFDVIRRYLEWRGFDLTFVQNYTDIDDKIIAKAEAEERPWDEVAKSYSREYEAVASALRLRQPDLLVKATDHIPDMIAMIAKLVDRGFAYEAGGSVWFSVESFPKYGQLSGRTLEDVRAGERVEPDPHKRQPLDFAVWKGAKPGEPSWESPWGPGRPGWHIECSAMSAKYLGMGFDIHGGGADLVFPHHENEIAQSEAAEGTSPFVRYWLHNGMVNLGSEKMSKSVGNLVLVKDLLTQVAPEVIRIISIAGNYRHDVDFSEASLEQARRTWERFKSFRMHAGEAAAEPSEEGRAYLDRFTAAMDDDFNTPVVMSVLHDLVKHGNTILASDHGGDRNRIGGLVAAFDEITEVLGIEAAHLAAVPAGEGSAEAFGSLDEAIPGGAERVAELIELRNQARRERRWDEADSIRDELGKIGISIEDTPEGTRWHIKT
ncbi:MAG: cysteine--tRNA ligase [Actinomycetota bacterium]|nr:cysteine--tRNA ligase [Actinomycetota bacterium]